MAMKTFAVAAILAVLLAVPEAAQDNPVQKCLELLSNLQAKILEEGKASTKVYDEFADWCEDRSRDTRHSIKTLTAEDEDLKAAIEKASDKMESLGTKIEELSSAISTDEADLKAAKLIRDKEASDFATTQKDLLDTIDTIERAIAILEREAKGGSLVQLQGVGSLTKALSALVEASALSAADSTRLTAMIQSSAAAGSEDGAGDGSSELGAPAAQAYGSHSGTVVETMEGLLDKAEAQLEDSRKAEASRATSFGVLQVALEGKLKVAKRDMAAAKKELAEAGQRKASAEGDLAVTEKDLKNTEHELADLHRDCMSKASDFEEEMKSRGEELAALSKAKQIIADMTGDATQQTYSSGQASFLQLEADSGAAGESEETQEAEPEKDETVELKAVRLIKRMARMQTSQSLMQLSFRLESALRSAVVSGADPFAKVKGLISDMVNELENAASAEAKHKMWCDREMSEASDKKEAKEVEIEKLTTKIDQLSAGLTELGEEVADLQKELSQLAKSQAQMDKIRQEEHALFATQKPEMEDGIKGVKLALETLREYYAKSDGAAHTAESGGGAGIIGLLQVVESDFSKSLSELIATEESSQKVFEQQTRENDVSRAAKQQDVKFKSKMLKANDKASMELTADRDGARAELDAVGEYLSKLEDQCVAKAEPYEERKKRREQELAGLQNALQLLGGQATLLQVDSASVVGHLRGVRPHLGA